MIFRPAELIPGKLYSFTDSFNYSAAIYVLPASKDEEGGWDINDEWTARVNVAEFRNVLLCVDTTIRFSPTVMSNNDLHGIFLAGENLVCVEAVYVKPCLI